MQRLTLTLALTSITIVGGAALFASATQADHIPIVAELKGPGSPNHPGNIIVINGKELISAGDGVVVYSVPGERWLVLTDVEASWPSSSGRPVLSERMGTVSTDKRADFLDDAFHSSTGLVFRPGAQVILREDSQKSSVNVSYSLTGSLVKP